MLTKPPRQLKCSHYQESGLLGAFVESDGLLSSMKREAASRVKRLGYLKDYWRHAPHSDTKTELRRVGILPTPEANENLSD